MESRRSIQLLQVIDGKLVDTMSNQSLNQEQVNNLLKSLTEWFGEKWVDISRPKKDGGFEPCGRNDAKTGKYPKCVPASKAARMTPEQIASAVR